MKLAHETGTRDLYKDIINHVQRMFHGSSFPKDQQSDIQVGVINKNVVGIFKDRTRGEFGDEFGG